MHLARSCHANFGRTVCIFQFAEDDRQGTGTLSVQDVTKQFARVLVEVRQLAKSLTHEEQAAADQQARGTEYGAAVRISLQLTQAHFSAVAALSRPRLT